MAARNDVTGDLIKSRVSNNDQFAANWDAIFGKRKTEEVVQEIAESEEPTVETDEASTGQ